MRGMLHDTKSIFGADRSSKRLSDGRGRAGGKATQISISSLQVPEDAEINMPNDVSTLC